jgi:hypothetical protein
VKRDVLITIMNGTWQQGQQAHQDEVMFGAHRTMQEEGVHFVLFYTAWLLLKPLFHFSSVLVRSFCDA